MWPVLTNESSRASALAHPLPKSLTFDSNSTSDSSEWIRCAKNTRLPFRTSDACRALPYFEWPREGGGWHVIHQVFNSIQRTTLGSVSYPSSLKPPPLGSLYSHTLMKDRRTDRQSQSALALGYEMFWHWKRGQCSIKSTFCIPSWRKACQQGLNWI